MKADYSEYDKLSKYKAEAYASEKPVKSKPPQQDCTHDHTVDATKHRDLARLIDYYRMRVENFEKERIEYMSRLNDLKIKNEELHKTEWELKRRQEEQIELEQALYEANITLNNERKKAIHYSNEIENCKLRVKEDRRRIQQLLQLSEPVEQTIKLYKNRKPETTEKYSNFNFETVGDESEYIANTHSVSIKKALMPKGKATRTKSQNRPRSKASTTSSLANQMNPFIFGNNDNKHAMYRIPPSDEKQTILRTVMFPSDHKVEEVNTQNNELKQEIHDLQMKYDSQLLKIEESRKLREEEFRQQLLNYTRQTNELLQKNQKLEKLNFEIVKDIMNLKQDNSIKEKKIYEDMEITKLNNKALENTLKEIVDKTRKERAHALNEYNKKTREITACLRGQARTQEENANIIKEQYNQIQKIYASKVKTLTERVKTITERCELLESKKNLSLQGYISEIAKMRKRIKSYQNYVMKVNNVTSNLPMHENMDYIDIGTGQHGVIYGNGYPVMGGNQNGDNGNDNGMERINEESAGEGEGEGEGEEEEMMVAA